MKDIICLILFFLILIYLSILDVNSKKVPNKYAFVLIIVAIVYTFDDFLLIRIIESIVMFIPLVIVWIFAKGGLGAGDVKVLFASTLMLGVNVVLIGMLIGMSIALLLIVVLKKIKDVKEIPLVPFITMGILIICIAK